jgi:hypothetical protein
MTDETTTVLTPTTLVKVSCSCGHWMIARSSAAFMAARQDHIDAVHAQTPKILDLLVMDELMKDETPPPPEAYEPVDHDDMGER